MADIRLVHGPEVGEALQEQDEIAVFRYRLNKPVFTLTLIVGGALLASAGWMWWGWELASISWIAVFSVLGGLGLSIGAVAAYWYFFAETHFLAMSTEKVFVGKRNRMWSIDWSLLDRESLGFENMALSSFAASLDFDVGGQQLPVLLYNAYVRLENMQGFMYRILQHLKQEAELDEEIEAPEALLGGEEPE